MYRIPKKIEIEVGENENVEFKRRRNRTYESQARVYKSVVDISAKV